MFSKLIFLKSSLFELIFRLPFLKKPFPKNSFGKRPIASKDKYLKLFMKTIKTKNIYLDNIEEKNGFSVNTEWFNELSLVTQTCIKKSDLNFNHGRLLYSYLSKYISEFIETKSDLTILETGTARGFSSICMSKAIIDRKTRGKIITIDCLPHNKKMFWNCISDAEGKKTRQELLYKWQLELSNIIFIQGWTIETLKRLGINRVHFAFLDAQHTKDSVLKEFSFIEKRQLKGDMIFFDDVTPNLFDGVCEAVKEIKKNYSYEVEILEFDKNRGYAIAKKI